MKNRIRSLLCIAAVALTSIGIVAQPASAAPQQSISCTIQGTYCDAGGIATTDAHVLHITTADVSAFYDIVVWDTANGNIVYERYSVFPFYDTNAWVGGLYSTYAAAMACYSNCDGAVLWVANY